MTLFEKIGGLAPIGQVVRQFYRDVLSSPRLAHHFEGIEMERLIDHQTKFLSHALGGPVEYSGRSLAASHKNLNISREDFAEVAQILQEALEDAGLTDEDIAQIMEVVGGTQDAVVTA